MLKAAANVTRAVTKNAVRDFSSSRTPNSEEESLPLSVASGLLVAIIGGDYLLNKTKETRLAAAKVEGKVSTAPEKQK